MVAKTPLMPSPAYDPALNDFFDVVSPHLILSATGRAAFAAVLERKELPKDTVLVRAGSICRHIFYIQSGLARTCYLKDGKDITDWISTEKSISTSIVSFITGLPDNRTIELLEPSIVWSVSSDEINRLYNEHHEIERFGRLLVSSGLVLMQQRFDDLHFATARDRYAKLMDQHPSVIQRVPLGMIASYLGITQETLSRIRAGHTF